MTINARAHAKISFHVPPATASTGTLSLSTLVHAAVIHQVDCVTVDLPLLLPLLITQR